MDNNTLLKYSLSFNFPLDKYGYSLEKILNNENRWQDKIVCSILDSNRKRYVSTTYTKENDYLKLIENIAFLNCNNKLSPRIIGIYPKDKTIICGYIGEFLSDYLINNPSDITLSLASVFNYLKDINSINKRLKKFFLPSIIKTSLQLNEEFKDDFELLPKLRSILPKLENSDIRFTYGSGIEDPHIWNFRIIKTKDNTQALTTDFDYFTDDVNSLCEMGYFYATLRWIKKTSPSFVCRMEEIILSLVQGQNLKSEFMFWIGVISSYCGYRDSLRNLMVKGGIIKLQEQYQLIQQFDEKIFCLADKLLANIEKTTELVIC